MINAIGKKRGHRVCSRRTRFSFGENLSEAVMLNLSPTSEFKLDKWGIVGKGPPTCRNDYPEVESTLHLEEEGCAMWGDIRDRPCRPQIRSFHLERSGIVTWAFPWNGKGGGMCGGFGWLRHGDLNIMENCKQFDKAGAWGMREDTMLNFVFFL